MGRNSWARQCTQWATEWRGTWDDDSENETIEDDTSHDAQLSEEVDADDSETETVKSETAHGAHQNEEEPVDDSENESIETIPYGFRRTG